MRASRVLYFWLLLALFHDAKAQSWSEWQCGSNKVFEGISWTLTIFNSDKPRINQCCKVHDRHYDVIRNFGDFPYSNDAADSIFKSCLDDACQSFSSRYIVKPIFTCAVASNTWLQRVFEFSF